MSKLIFAAILIIIALLVYYLGFYNKNVQPQGQKPEANSTAVSAQGQAAGLKIEILKEGSGSPAQKGNVVTVHYTGLLEDGTKFDSSLDKGSPFSFQLGLGRVIQGWEQGVLGMKIGEQRRLTVPSDLAYGDAGFPGVIPPKATLIFEVELLGIK